MKLQFGILVVICCLSVSVHGEDERGFEKACKTDGSVPCESFLNDPLRCIPTSDGDGVCGCLENMFNNVELDRCVSLHGGVCTLNADEKSPSKMCTQFASCKKSETVEEGECACDADSRHDPATDQCILTYNAKRCTKDTHCDMDAALACHNGKCLCKNLKYHHFDEKTETCISLAGGSCSSNGIREPLCYSGNTTCTGNVCTCKSPQIPDTIGYCGLPWGATCVHNTDCSSTSSLCEEQKCVCPPSEEYNEGKKTCTIRVGHTCAASELPCIENSECIRAMCTCITGYQQHGNGRCGGLVGTSCSEDASCYDKGYLQCGLRNTCVCRAGYRQEVPEDKTCKGISGEACPADSGEQFCISGASCNNELCICKARHEAATDRSKCLAFHGEKCNSRVFCSEAKHLRCNGNTCGCSNPEDQLYEEGKDGCLAKAGKACGASARNIECGANSQCQEHKCECSSGHKANKNGECVKSEDGDDENGDGGAGTLVASTVLIVAAMVAGHWRLL